MSDWNLFLERALETRLGVEEYRLYLSIARSTLGFRRRGEYVGDDLLRERSRLHGRSFERARDGLVAKRLIRFERGKPGRGNRGYYELILDEEEESTADERDLSPHAGIETPAEKLAESHAESTAERPALTRGRKGNREKGKEEIKNGGAAERLPDPLEELQKLKDALGFQWP